MNFEFHAPSAIIYGKDSSLGAASYAASLSIGKPLIVSDAFLSRSGAVARFAKNFSDMNQQYALYAEIDNEPTVSDVENGLRAFELNKCDGVVCLGGGSAIDTAKAIAVMSANPGSIADYMGYHKVKNPRAPLIAVPTTAGTGSEATRVVVITDTDNDVKMMCLDNAFMPDIAIIDYGLTLSMPKNLTAYVGMDALTHAIEAYVSVKANNISDIYALRAVELINAGILTAYNDPSDEAAREGMMLGANMAGIAFSNASVCAVHGMSRPIGAYFHVPHGLSNAMLLPIVTEHSAGGGLRRYAEAAARMGFSPGAGDDLLARMLIDRLRHLNAALNIPNLRGYGVDEQKFNKAIPMMVDAAIASGSPGNNPKAFSPEEMADIYRKAYNYVS